MKTAISIPDSLFQVAEEAAKRMGLSRSRLYAKAVQSYLKNHSDNDVTEKLNRVYAKESSSLEPVISKIQSSSIKPEKW
jgi:metal-responsive CopG/Arc/MetJ family transcriptional regulator